MRRVLWVLLVLCAGCYRGGHEEACHVFCDHDVAGNAGPCPGSLVCQPSGLCTEPSGLCPIDPTIDAALDGAAPLDVSADAPSNLCYGHGFYRPCFAADPTTNITIAGTIDTTTSNASCVIAHQNTDSRDDICLVLGQMVTLTGVIKVRGSHPLVVVGTTQVLVQAADIDVADSSDLLPAAGGNNWRCTSGPPPQTDGAHDVGGGAGGSFFTQGGDGGASGTETGGAHGATSALPLVIRGGCDGQAGQTAIGMPGLPGRSGGAIWFLGPSVTFNGAVINASGGPGRGTGTITAGGGGGAGGMIGVDSPTIAILGTVTFMANGGGGSGGGDADMGSPGGYPTSYNAAASGGVGTNSSGGAGGVFTAGGAPGSPVPVGGAGGGGGGGGYIILVGTSAGQLGSRFSPPVQLIAPQ